MSTMIGSSDALRGRDEPQSQPQSSNMGLVAALLVLALVAGVAAGWWRWGRTYAEGSPEVTFARNMAAHHDQAVEMAVIMRDRTTDPTLRTLLIDLILTQQNQIGQMNGWLSLWGRPLVSGAPMAGHGAMMGMASQQEVNALGTLPLAEAEVSFLNLMITHHKGGVQMAQTALAQTEQPQVARLAQSIIDGQQSEIALMQGMLRERGAEVPTAPAPMPEGEH